MKKYAILAIAIVLAVLLTAASVDAFSFKFFKPAVKLAKVTPTTDKSNFISKLPFLAKKTETTTTTTTQGSGFCGHSSYGQCNTNSDCVVFGCSAQGCGAVFDSEHHESACDMKECYYTDGKYYMQCGCLKNQCQWARPYQFSNPNQGQGQGSGQGSGNGNGQSSQGQGQQDDTASHQGDPNNPYDQQQGNGMGEGQSQNYGESSS